MTPAQLLALVEGESLVMGAKQATPEPALSDVDDLARFAATTGR